MREDRRLEFACEEDCAFVGTTAAILIGSGIAAAAGLGSAAIQSHQVSKAVDAQKEATNQAIQNLEPFRQTGTQAFTTLGALMGLPGGGGGGAAPQAAQYDQPFTPAQQNFAHYSPTGGYIGKDLPMSEQMTNPFVNLDSSGRTAAQHGASLSSYGPQAQNAPTSMSGPMLRGQTPTGAMVQVPAEKQAEFTQNGGKILGQL